MPPVLTLSSGSHKRQGSPLMSGASAKWSSSQKAIRETMANIVFG